MRQNHTSISEGNKTTASRARINTKRSIEHHTSTQNNTQNKQSFLTLVRGGEIRLEDRRPGSQLEQVSQPRWRPEPVKTSNERPPNSTNMTDNIKTESNTRLQ